MSLYHCYHCAVDTVKYFLHAACNLKQQQLHIYSNSSNNNNNIDSLSLKLYFSLNDIKAPLSLRFRRSWVLLVFDKQQLMVIKLLLPLFPSSYLSYSLTLCVCVCVSKRQQKGRQAHWEEWRRAIVVRACACLCNCVCVHVSVSLPMCVCFSLHGMRPISKRYCPLSNGKMCDATRLEQSEVRCGKVM